VVPDYDILRGQCHHRVDGVVDAIGLG